jgi:hypothetical protein
LSVAKAHFSKEAHMTRTAVSLAILALGLAACAAPGPQSNEPRIATNEVPYRSGQGVVIAANPAPAPVSAAAGASTSSSSATSAPYRLTVRMSDGSVQYVDVDSPEIAVGSRVQLGADKTIRRL